MIRLVDSSRVRPYYNTRTEHNFSLLERDIPKQSSEFVCTHCEVKYIEHDCDTHKEALVVASRLSACTL